MDAQNRDIRLAWQTGLLASAAVFGKLPALDTLLIRTQTPRERQVSFFRQISQAFGIRMRVKAAHG